MDDKALMRKVLVEKLDEWVKCAPEPDKKVFLSAEGGGSSMRDLLEDVRQGTPRGNEFIEQYVGQFLDFMQFK